MSSSSVFDSLCTRADSVLLVEKVTRSITDLAQSLPGFLHSLVMRSGGLGDIFLHREVPLRRSPIVAADLIGLCESPVRLLSSSFAISLAPLIAVCSLPPLERVL